MKKVWTSNRSGRSILGWKIKEEIFAIFFILVIISLSNDKNINKKVCENTSIQIFIFIVVIYCIYNKIPWSLSFILVFIISILFSDLLKNVKDKMNSLFLNENEETLENIEYNKKPFMNIGARILKWIDVDKKKDKKTKGILKKVRFKNDKENNICQEVSDMFGLEDNPSKSTNKLNSSTSTSLKKDIINSKKDIFYKTKIFDDYLSDTDNETEPDTEPDTDKENEDFEDLKKDLKKDLNSLINDNKLNI